MGLRSFLCLIFLAFAAAASKKKPHGHKGVLPAYDGKQIPLKVTNDQSKKLEKGEPVLFNEQSGKSGRGVVIQDVNATSAVCMSKIRDLARYPKMVPKVRSVDIYENKKFANGTSKTGAQFDVGVLGLRFGYYLMLTHEPKYNTLTWTLDYKYNSDFDDNVGHWQVMPHPSKTGWTRVLYSTNVKLFPWIPQFVVNFLTSKALTESTGWVKKESEAEQVKINIEQSKNKKAGSIGAIDTTKLFPSWLRGGFKDEDQRMARPIAFRLRPSFGSWGL